MVDLLRPITEKELYKRNELKRYIATVHYIDVTEKDDNTTSDKTSVEIIQDGNGINKTDEAIEDIKQEKNPEVAEDHKADTYRPPETPNKPAGTAIT